MNKTRVQGYDYYVASNSPLTARDFIKLFGATKKTSLGALASKVGINNVSGVNRESIKSMIIQELESRGVPEPLKIKVPGLKAKNAVTPVTDTLNHTNEPPVNNAPKLNGNATAPKNNLSKLNGNANKLEFNVNRKNGTENVNVVHGNGTRNNVNTFSLKKPANKVFKLNNAQKKGPLNLGTSPQALRVFRKGANKPGETMSEIEKRLGISGTKTTIKLRGGTTTSGGLFKNLKLFEPPQGSKKFDAYENLLREIPENIKPTQVPVFQKAAQNILNAPTNVDPTVFLPKKNTIAVDNLKNKIAKAEYDSKRVIEASGKNSPVAQQAVAKVNELKQKLNEVKVVAPQVAKLNEVKVVAPQVAKVNEVKVTASPVNAQLRLNTVKLNQEYKNKIKKIQENANRAQKILQLQLNKAKKNSNAVTIARIQAKTEKNKRNKELAISRERIRFEERKLRFGEKKSGESFFSGFFKKKKINWNQTANLSPETRARIRELKRRGVQIPNSIVSERALKNFYELELESNTALLGRERQSGVLPPSVSMGIPFLPEPGRGDVTVIELKNEGNQRRELEQFINNRDAPNNVKLSLKKRYLDNSSKSFETARNQILENIRSRNQKVKNVRARIQALKNIGQARRDQIIIEKQKIFENLVKTLNLNKAHQIMTSYTSHKNINRAISNAREAAKPLNKKKLREQLLLNLKSLKPEIASGIRYKFDVTIQENKTNSGFREALSVARRALLMERLGSLANKKVAKEIEEAYLKNGNMESALRRINAVPKVTVSAVNKILKTGVNASIKEARNKAIANGTPPEKANEDAARKLVEHFKEEYKKTGSNKSSIISTWSTLSSKFDILQNLTNVNYENIANTKKKNAAVNAVLTGEITLEEANAFKNFVQKERVGIFGSFKGLIERFKAFKRKSKNGTQSNGGSSNSRNGNNSTGASSNSEKVTRIQASVRGYLVRKKLKQVKEFNKFNKKISQQEPITNAMINDNPFLNETNKNTLKKKIKNQQGVGSNSTKINKLIRQYGFRENNDNIKQIRASLLNGNLSEEYAVKALERKGKLVQISKMSNTNLIKSLEGATGPEIVVIAKRLHAKFQGVPENDIITICKNSPKSALAQLTVLQAMANGKNINLGIVSGINITSPTFKKYNAYTRKRGILKRMEASKTLGNLITARGVTPKNNNINKGFSLKKKSIVDALIESGNINALTEALKYSKNARLSNRKKALEGQRALSAFKKAIEDATTNKNVNTALSNLGTHRSSDAENLANRKKGNISKQTTQTKKETLFKKLKESLNSGNVDGVRDALKGLGDEKNNSINEAKKFLSIMDSTNTSTLLTMATTEKAKNLVVKKIAQLENISERNAAKLVSEPKLLNALRAVKNGNITKVQVKALEGMNIHNKANKKLEVIRESMANTFARKRNERTKRKVLKGLATARIESKKKKNLEKKANNFARKKTSQRVLQEFANARNDSKDEIRSNVNELLNSNYEGETFVKKALALIKRAGKYKNLTNVSTQLRAKMAAEMYEILDSNNKNNETLKLYKNFGINTGNIPSLLERQEFRSRIRKSKDLSETSRALLLRVYPRNPKTEVKELSGELTNNNAKQITLHLKGQLPKELKNFFNQKKESRYERILEKLNHELLNTKVNGSDETESAKIIRGIQETLKKLTKPVINSRTPMQYGVVPDGTIGYELMKQHVIIGDKKKLGKIIKFIHTQITRIAKEEQKKRAEEKPPEPFSQGFGHNSTDAQQHTGVSRARGRIGAAQQGNAFFSEIGLKSSPRGNSSKWTPLPPRAKNPSNNNSVSEVSSSKSSGGPAKINFNELYKNHPQILKKLRELQLTNTELSSIFGRVIQQKNNLTHLSNIFRGNNRAKKIKAVTLLFKPPNKNETPPENNNVEGRNAKPKPNPKPRILVPLQPMLKKVGQPIPPRPPSASSNKGKGPANPPSRPPSASKKTANGSQTSSSTKNDPYKAERIAVRKLLKSKGTNTTNAENKILRMYLERNSSRSEKVTREEYNKSLNSAGLFRNIKTHFERKLLKLKANNKSTQKIERFFSGSHGKWNVTKPWTKNFSN
jgi:hypothetical protein